MSLAKKGDYEKDAIEAIYAFSKYNRLVYVTMVTLFFDLVCSRVSFLTHIFL